MTTGKIWMDGTIVDWDNASIHILTHSLHYGTAVFEGIRCYKTTEGLAIFRLDDHVQRLIDSCKIYYMDLRYSADQIKSAIFETVKANGNDGYYVRPIVYYGHGKMGVNPLPNKVCMAVAAWIWDENVYSNSEIGIRVVVSTWIRFDSRSLPVLAKATANYANSVLARIEAINLGYDEAIMLNSNGNVAEATAENVFIVKNGCMITPPLTAGALRGITRDSILTLGKELGVTCTVSDFGREDLYLADEIFLTGTAAGIKPVTEIDQRVVGDGKVGDLTMRLISRFQYILEGSDNKYSAMWLTPIS
ncbi:MAG: branched-chain amino acid transaminase [Nitrososphaeraceae archaeon]